MKGLLVLVQLLWESVRDRKQFRALKHEWRQLTPDRKTILEESKRIAAMSNEEKKVDK